METYQLEQAARRRIASRLLPFVFLLYAIQYVDRVNVSFANLRMSADLGFSANADASTFQFSSAVHIYRGYVHEH